MARFIVKGPEETDLEDAEFVFRVPTNGDLWEMYDRLPILPDVLDTSGRGTKQKKKTTKKKTTKKKAAKKAAAKKASEMTAEDLERIRQTSKVAVAYQAEEHRFFLELLERCSIDPICTRETLVDPGNVVCLKEQPAEWVGTVGEKLFELAGWSPTKAKAMGKEQGTSGA